MVKNTLIGTETAVGDRKKKANWPRVIWRWHRALPVQEKKNPRTKKPNGTEAHRQNTRPPSQVLYGRARKKSSWMLELEAATLPQNGKDIGALPYTSLQKILGEGRRGKRTMGKRLSPTTGEFEGDGKKEFFKTISEQGEEWGGQKRATVKILQNECIDGTCFGQRKMIS